MIEIEVMNEKSVADVSRLEKKCFHDAWDEATLTKTLSNNSIVYLTARLDCKIVGYIGYYDLIDEYSIINIAVDENCRRKGIADALLCALRDRAVTASVNIITLEVRASNIPAISLYEKNGYTKTSEKENYYTKPRESAYFYRQEIKNADTEL